MGKFNGAFVKEDPPPREVFRFEFPPETYLRQGGLGGWEEVPHARGKSTTEWRGTPLYQLTLPLLFDATRRQRGDLEQTCIRLELLALPTSPHDPASEPPKVRFVHGYGAQLWWVINEVSWTHFEFDPATLRRVQARCDVTLLQYRRSAVHLTPVERLKKRTAG